MTIEKGMLVHLYRRRNSGIGIAVKHIPDVVEEMKAAEELEQMTARWAQMPWQERQGYLISFIDSIPDHELAQAFLMCNYFYNSPPQKKFIKFKKAFVLVRWLKKPSEYDRESISNTMGWYPLVWLKEMK